MGLEQRGWVRGVVTSQSGKMLTRLHFVCRTVFSSGKRKMEEIAHRFLFGKMRERQRHTIGEKTYPENWGGGQVGLGGRTYIYVLGEIGVKTLGRKREIR